MNFDELKPNNGNFLPLQVKPIYIFFRLMVYPKAGVGVGGHLLVVALNSIVYLLQKQRTNNNLVQSHMLWSGATAADPPGLTWAL